MEKDNMQKELFEFDAPRKQPGRFGGIFQKTDFVISLSAEKLVFISIGIVMLLVVAFALGVEKGKSVCVRAPEASVPKVQPPAVQVKTVIPTTNIAPKEKAQVPVVKAAPDLAQSSQDLTDKTKPYTIVAAAFSKETFAAKEVTRLKGSGLDSFVIKSDPYYLVCVGAFANKDSAQRILTKVRQMHKDAYVRLR